MEDVHLINDRSWIAKEDLNLKSYFEDFHNLVKRPASSYDSNPNSTKKAIRKLMRLDGMALKDELSGDLFSKIEDACNIDKLAVPDELRTCSYAVNTDGPDGVFIDRFRSFPIPKEGIETLKTLQKHQIWLSNASKDENYRFSKFSRYPDLHWFESAPKIPKKKMNLKMIDQEMVLSVRLYRSMKPTKSFNISSNCKYNQEFLVIGKNLLSDLRDHIVCPVDYYVAENIADKPFKQGKVQRAKEVYPSGFFFINNCFYNDMRYPNAIDYSSTIRNWSNLSRRGIGPFKTGKMEETRIEDLSIRLGYPYVYVHQGNHEHLLVFTNARLMSVDDPQNFKDYPYERSVGQKHCNYCMCCSVKMAKWVTKNNARVPEDPFLWCQDCFKSFNYDGTNSPIGSFQAYPYVDSAAL